MELTTASAQALLSTKKIEDIFFPLRYHSKPSVGSFMKSLFRFKGNIFF
jgi:hypothetical protein